MRLGRKLWWSSSALATQKVTIIARPWQVRSRFMPSGLRLARLRSVSQNPRKQISENVPYPVKWPLLRMMWWISLQSLSTAEPKMAWKKV